MASVRRGEMSVRNSMTAFEKKPPLNINNISASFVPRKQYDQRTPAGKL